MKRLARRWVSSVFWQLLAGALIAAVFPSLGSDLQLLLSWSSIGVIGLFLVTGLELNPRAPEMRQAFLWRIFFWSSLLPLVFNFAVARGFGFKAEIALLISAVLLTTGTGVTVQTLLRFDFLKEPSGRALAILAAVDDLPALVLLLALMVSLGGGMGEGFSAVSGLLSVFLGLLGGAALRGALPSVAGKIEGPLKKILRVLLPFYFVSLGLRMRVEALFHPELFALTLCLLAASFAGKWFPALRGSRGLGGDAPIVAWGLVPRGVPGLVFAAAAHAAGLIDEKILTVLLTVVALTTWIGLWGLERHLLARQST